MSFWKFISGFALFEYIRKLFKGSEHRNTCDHRNFTPGYDCRDYHVYDGTEEYDVDTLDEMDEMDMMYDMDDDW